MINQQYLLFALALILMITNCLGAIFTIRRNRLEQASQQRQSPVDSGMSISFGWARIYGRFAVAQAVAVALALSATVANFSHSIVQLFSSWFSG
jgi:hypothetical protein